MTGTSDIDAILAQEVSLPSLPGIIQRALDLLANDQSSLRDVGELLSTDPGTAVRVLQVANSAAYGLRHRVASVEHAVPLLGAGTVRNLCLTATVFEHLKRGTDAFVRHGICSGVLMELLTKASPSVDCSHDEAFIYGVLHKVGMLIFLEHLPKPASLSRSLARDRGLPLYRAEREVIGADYAEMGARLAAHWGLPDAIAGAIAGQHEIARCEVPAHRPMAGLLQVANAICMASGLQAEPEDTAAIEEAAWQATGLTNALLAGVLEDFFAALPSVDALVDEVMG